MSEISSDDEVSSTTGETGADGRYWSASNVIKDKSTDTDKYICLRVTNCDDSYVLDICVNYTTPLGHVMRLYCRKFGLQMEKFHFVLDGVRVYEQDTPKSLAMLAEDMLVAFQMVR